MKEEILFDKYEKQGVDYHYREINKRDRGMYNAFLYARYKILIDLIFMVLKYYFNEKRKIKLLDIGCGDGVLLFLLNQDTKSKNFELYGIDYSEKAINIARKKNPTINYSIANAYDLPFENNFFDLIISSDLIEHLKEPEKMLEEIRRVGKNQSYYIISTPIRFTEKVLDKLHYHEFFQNEFKNLLKGYFSSIKLIETHRLLYYLLYSQKIRILNKQIFLYRYLINRISIFFNINPFLINKKKENGRNTYMYALGMIKEN